jgi:hypothetical protein
MLGVASAVGLEPGPLGWHGRDLWQGTRGPAIIVQDFTIVLGHALYFRFGCVFGRPISIGKTH